LGYSHPQKIYGELIEDRGTQITFSALGQQAPLRLKEKWKEEHTPDKLKIAQTLQKHLPDLEVRAAGYTSIDVTRKGIDKEYGIRQIKKHLGISFDEMLFVGDALFPGGNDYAVFRTGVPCLEVKGPEDTKKIIRSLLN
jgi:HAD superfamily hydrolase (TIGR01484 family)